MKKKFCKNIRIYEVIGIIKKVKVVIIEEVVGIIENIKSEVIIAFSIKERIK